MNKIHDFYQVSLKVLLKNKKGEFLLLKARAQDTYGGFYDLPGGRIDVDEFSVSFSEIIKRELAEELGEVKYELNPKPVAIGRHLISAEHTRSNKDTHVFYAFFEAQYKGGDIKVSEEHEEYKWVDLTKVDRAKYLKSGNLEGVEMYLRG